jgi:hypothetical protein
LKKVAVLVAAGLIATLASLVGTAKATPGVDYSLSGGYIPTQECTLDPATCTDTYDYVASGSCEQSCTGFPSSADVTISVSGQTAKTFPPSPCISKSVSGTFSISWSDATTSTGTISGHPHDGKSYALSGTIIAGAYTGGSISSLLYYPPSPCLIGSFSGGLTLYPPNPA